MRGHAAFSIDVVTLTPRDGKLAVLLARNADAASRERWILPWGTPREGEALDAAARRLARQAAHADVSWIEQVGAFDQGKRHPSGGELSVAYVAVLPLGAEAPPADAEWRAVDSLPPLPPRQRAMVDAAVEELRAWADRAPIAFRLLPKEFTLSDLQSVYEILLGRRLHKASFRRALHGAAVVEPTDAWRSEGRGRPAQLFRYSTRKRRPQSPQRGVRFDAFAGG